MHAGCCQRMASGDQAPVPWRLSHSVILLAGPAAASSRRTADYALVKESHVFVPSWRISSGYGCPVVARSLIAWGGR